MRATRIIEPLNLEENIVAEKSKSSFSFLEQGEFHELMSFDEFLTEINLSKDEYIKSIQCTHNNFSKDMPVMWKANIDAQYVLNAYATTS